jgi:hypothetical protein
LTCLRPRWPVFPRSFLSAPGELLSFVIQSRRLTANPVASAFLTVNLVGEVITLGGRMPVVESAAPYIEVSCRVDGQRGSKRRRPLLDCATARFEDAVPVRPFPWSWGGRHFPGWYWAATTGGTSALSRGWSGTGWFSWTSILRPAALLASAQDELHTYLDASRAIRTSPTNDRGPTPAAPFLPGS